MSLLAKTLKIITFAYEAFLAIPIVGGLFIFGNLWVPLFVALVLHIVAVLVLKMENAKYAGNVLGIVTSILGIIPFLGWFLHCVTALILLIEMIIDFQRA